MLTFHFLTHRCSLVLLSILCLVLAGQASAQIANDNFATPTLIGPRSYAITQSNAGTSAEIGEPSHGSYNATAFRSLWYRLVPTFTGFYSFDVTTSTAPSPRLAVYRGTRLNSLVVVKKTESTMLVELTKGVPYMIAMDASGLGDLTVSGSMSLAVIKASSFERSLPLLETDDGWEPSEYGKIVLNIALGGTFSGRLYLGTGSYPFKGRLQPGGTLVEIPRAGLSTVRLNLTAQSFLGEVSGITCDYQPDVTQARSKLVTLNQRVTTVLASFARRYSLVDSRLVGAPNLMRVGHSLTVGTVLVTTKGQMSGTMVLPDGVVTTFAAGALTPGGGLLQLGEGSILGCFHNVLYGGGGQATCDFTLKRTNPAAPVYSGQMHWVRERVDVRRKLYHRDSLVDNAPLLLDPYIPPQLGQRLWHNESASANASLFYTNVQHTSSSGFPIVLSTANRVTAPPAIAISAVSVTMTPSTGMAVGSFRVGFGAPYESISFRAFYIPSYHNFYGVQATVEGTTYMGIATP